MAHNDRCAQKIINRLSEDYQNLITQLLSMNNELNRSDAVLKISSIVGRCQHLQKRFDAHFAFNSSNTQRDIDTYCDEHLKRPLNAIEDFLNIVYETMKKLIDGVDYDDNHYMIIAYDAYHRIQECKVCAHRYLR